MSHDCAPRLTEVLGGYSNSLVPQNSLNTSLCRGSFRPEDIFAAVSPLLPRCLVEEFSAADEDERVELMFEKISDWLCEQAPPGHYFGSHPGDSSDFGFWELPTAEEQPTTHEIELDGRMRYFMYDDVTDSYGEELLPGDTSPFHVSASLRIRTEEATNALEKLGDSAIADSIRSYIVFLERLASPLLYA